MQQQVVNPGKPDCVHPRVFYQDMGLMGSQSWSCDVPGCDRQESLKYDPPHAGRRMRFPPSALVRTPNPDFGGERFYSHQANTQGVVEKEFLKEERVPVSLTNLL
jgi:hypothetical protein